MPPALEGLCIKYVTEALGMGMGAPVGGPGAAAAPSSSPRCVLRLPEPAFLRCASISDGLPAPAFRREREGMTCGGEGMCVWTWVGAAPSVAPCTLVPLAGSSRWPRVARAPSPARGDRSPRWHGSLPSRNAKERETDIDKSIQRLMSILNLHKMRSKGTGARFLPGSRGALGLREP